MTKDNGHHEHDFSIVATRRGWHVCLGCDYKAPIPGKCSRCGTPLSDPESLRRGIGPECYEKVRRAGNNTGLA